MEFEFWWLLALPVFFGMGWIAARVDLKSLLSESRQMPSSYFRGLNFLLNEQPDKAIESFLQVAKENPQTVELQFALGSLFRRRGEVDRAIRMHQDLVAREDLPDEERRKASFELAAGLLQGGPARPRRSGAGEDGRVGPLARSPSPPARHLHPGEGLGEGHRRGAQARGERQAQLPEGDRQLLLRARDHRGDPRPPRGGAGAASTRRSRPTASACARTCCAASGSPATAATRRRSPRGRRSSRRTRPISASRPRAWWRATRRWAARARGSRWCAGCRTAIPGWTSSTWSTRRARSTRATRPRGAWCATRCAAIPRWWAWTA